METLLFIGRIIIVEIKYTEDGVCVKTKKGQDRNPALF